MYGGPDFVSLLLVHTEGDCRSG
ncbi:uncharacterized protein METZ01_LOCUS433614, partial [marine metagenome]